MRSLFIVYDVSDLDEKQTAALHGEALAQAEDSDDHPTVPVRSLLTKPNSYLLHVQVRERLNDYNRTGYQDCDNAMSIDEFNIAKGVREGLAAEAIVDATLDGDDWQDRDAWLDQQEETDRLVCGDDALWTAWKTGWRASALVCIRCEMRERCISCGERDGGNTCCDPLALNTAEAIDKHLGDPAHVSARMEDEVVRLQASGAPELSLLAGVKNLALAEIERAATCPVSTDPDALTRWAKRELACAIARITCDTEDTAED